MKKILVSIVFIILGFVPIQAQIYYYKAFQFSCKETYGNWIDWQPTDILITINLSSDVVNIYSNKTQIYKIVKYVKNYTDTSGGRQIEFKFIDQDYDRGTMRLRTETNGNSQMYIDFANVMWVYNLVRIR